MLGFIDKRKNANHWKALSYQVQNSARNPVFFEGLGVPDTIQGRLDLVLFHLGIVSAGLTLRDGKSKLAQYIFDDVLRTLQEGLRQAGVGDLGVPHKMKDIMRAANGLTDLMYKHVSDTEGLKAVIFKNLYHNQPGQESNATVAALYAQQHMTALLDHGPDHFTFGEPH